MLQHFESKLHKIIVDFWRTEVEKLHCNSIINPILTGLFESKFLLGGGSIWPPLQISAPKGPIAAKFCMDVKTHVKSTATTFLGGKLFIYYDLCKLDA